MRYLIGSTVIALGLVFGSAGEADAQSYAQQVWNQLQRAYNVANGSEYRMRNYIMGHLNNGATDTWTFPLSANTEYLVTGACDSDCSDLDIYIKDPNGNTIAQDTSTDDIPVVRFTPRTSGRYTVDVRMYQCSVNPCYFGFGIFQK